MPAHMRTMKANHCNTIVVIYFLFTTFGSGTKLSGATDCEPKNSSTSIDFGAPNGNAEGSGFECSWFNAAQDVCGQGTQKFWITRAIGNGLSSDFATTSEKAVTDSSGRLIDAASLVRNGLVSQNVKMLFSYSSYGSLTTYVAVSLNGTKIADIKLVPGKSKTVCLDVPISTMRFAHRPEMRLQVRS